MKEVFFTQESWQAISFADLGVPLNRKRPAGEEFYNAFYCELARRYPHFENLPESWRATKARTASCLAGLLDPGTKVLSFGSGIGAVERSLIQDYGFSDLYLWDYSSRAGHYSPQLRHRYLPGDRWPQVDRETRFDVIYLVQVLYALNQSQAVTTLERLRPLLAPDGRMILVDTSIIPGENHHARGDLPVHSRLRRKFISRLGSRVTSSGRRLVASGAISAVQGWGWQRDNACVQSICSAAGYVGIASHSCGGESITIAHVDEP